MRRTFLDDLLDRHTDPVRLGELATRLGFPSFTSVLVAVAGAERDVDDGGAVHRRVRADLQSRAPERHLVITAKDGRLVVIAVDTTADVLGGLLSNAVRTEHTGRVVSDVAWQIGIGDLVSSLEDVGTSYRQAVEAMRLGRIFALDGPREFSHLFAERLFGSEPELSRSLVDTVLGPLPQKPRAELLATLTSLILELAYRAVPLIAGR